MPDAVVVDVVRSPTGKGRPGGLLSHLHPVDLLAETLQGLLDRTGVEPALVDDVIGGCVTQSGQQGGNVTRHAVLAAGLPVGVPATTVDRQCGSSQQAVHFAAQAVQAGAARAVIACGVESMSRAPMWSNVAGSDPYGTRLLGRFPDGLVPQGISAELVCARWGLTRAVLDEFAARSHARADAARALHAANMVPVTGRDGGFVDGVDETVRPETTSSRLGGLPPAFRDDAVGVRYPEIGWRVSAGNSSPLSDGASAALVMDAELAHSLGMQARARVHSMAVVGDDPELMLMGVVPATWRVLERSGLGIEDIDLFEVNEAFACVPLAWQREVNVDLDKLNVSGGAIALGHPLGATGTRLLAGLMAGLETNDLRFGLQTMCEAGGMANAMIVERL